VPDEARSLRVAFESEASFLLEYQTNIADGGTFISTSVGFGVREPVRVEIALEYCSELIELELEGEVVHVAASELAGAGATPGVAVQFTLKASDIRDSSEPVVKKGVSEVEREACARDELSQAEEAILDLAGVGMSIGKVIDVIPEPDEEIRQQIARLLTRGLIRLLD
jgi:hypothetical protein